MRNHVKFQRKLKHLGNLPVRLHQFCHIGGFQGDTKTLGGYFRNFWYFLRAIKVNFFCILCPFGKIIGFRTASKSKNIIPKLPA